MAHKTRRATVEQSLPLEILAERANRFGHARAQLNLEASETPDILAAARYPLQPPVRSSDLQAAARVLRANSPAVATFAVDADKLPVYEIPEVVLLGRSNVGKSSLINALTGQRKLAKTSSSAGRTRTISHYEINRKISLVDMPGYGHRSREEWGEFIVGYLNTRKQLNRAYLLIDARRGLMAADWDVISILDSIPVPFQVVFTKIECLYDDTYYKHWTRAEEALVKKAVSCYPQLLGVSAQKGMGLNELAWSMVQACNITLKGRGGAPTR
ncbi:P-loop containing nucleoside triphosphate hydrolase protein [Thamnocephalis sphaerospora]|uniref:GTP-binding protein 8 n=1 Tax=Thamnocephalis sphaerospora TaxID=78915 RepID=A0A4P9XH27_9FUNG|nr:P-loop containing nucleoside triphosphate hydrolase protein [Thamnocephalis sphaerospora]|eukprot:RKP04918.1 P-loop containing nucleoside triphosphate hydrolase protein [Thamnocephalis sphaerospora]